MSDLEDASPDSTAARVALWRALHVQIDPPPHVLEDEIGLRLLAPREGWQQRGDMHPQGTKTFRASIVARARFVEDLVLDELARGVQQYVILGAGLDSFAQRRADIAPRLHIFEVDRPGPQQWKRQRLIELGFGLPDHLHFVPVDFEQESWWDELIRAGFDLRRAAIVSSLGVSMYLTKDAIATTLQQMATLAARSTLAMSFLLRVELMEPQERAAFDFAQRGASASGTPFISFFSPEEIIALALDCGFKDAHVVSGTDLERRYFAGRSDGLRASNAEQLMIATT